MTNSRMTNDELMTKHDAQIPRVRLYPQGRFVIRISGFIRRSSFVIRHC